MKQVRFINEWERPTKFGFFEIIYTQINIVVGKVSLFSISVLPGVLDALRISVVILGFGFSVSVGQPQNRNWYTYNCNRNRRT